MNKQHIAIEIVDKLQVLGFLQAHGTESRIIRLTTKTPVVKIKSGNPWHKVSKNKVVGTCNLFKVTESSGGINWDYVKAVKTRIAEQTDTDVKNVVYERGESWLQHLMTLDNKPLCVCVNKYSPDNGEYYLQYFPFKGQIKSYYVDGAGAIVPKELVEQWAYAEQERPDYKPVTIAPKLSNIVELKASGAVLSVEDAEEIKAAFAVA